MLEERPKTVRLEARLPASVHSLLQQAASLQGKTMTDFVVSAAREAAEDTISRHGAMEHGAMEHGAMEHGAMEHGAMELTLENQQRFADALLNPVPVAPALKRSIADHRRLFDPS
jgi:uncharacterized protein (DUF1778 family)